MAEPTPAASGTYYENTSASVDFAAPSGVVDNSVVVICAYVDGATDPTITPPTGFVQAENSPVYLDETVPQLSSQNHRLMVMWHRASGSESGPYTMTLGSSRFVAGQAHRFEGVVQSGTPFDSGTDAAGVETPDPANTSPPVNITTEGSDRLVLHAATNWAGGTWTPPTGFTKHQQGGFGHSTLASKAQAAAGATGSLTATLTTNDKMQAWAGALKPATESSNEAVIAGSLPNLGGSLTADLINPAAISSALPSLGGALAADLKATAVIAGDLPGLGGSLAASLTATAQISGALPGLGGSLTGDSQNQGVIAGDLPGLSGSLIANLISSVLVGGQLPSLGGSLQVESSLPTLTAVIGGNLPTLGGYLFQRVIATARELVWAKLTGDPDLQALGFDEDNIFTDHSLDTPQRRPLMVLRWQGVDVGLGPVNQRRLQVWVHDRPADYDRIDQTLRRLRTLLSSIEAVRLDGGIAGVHTAIWEGDSDDLRDDEVRTITRWTQFRLTGSAF